MRTGLRGNIAAINEYERADARCEQHIAGTPPAPLIRKSQVGLDHERIGDQPDQAADVRRGVQEVGVAGPRVVFADEPTGALDSLNGEVVMDLLVGAAREQGASIVLVTHEPRVAAYADREVVLRDGALAATVGA